MVDIGLCCNQILYYWKMPILSGNIQWSCTILEVKNISVVHVCYKHHEIYVGKSHSQESPMVNLP